MTRLFGGLNGTIGETLPSDLRGQLEAAVRAAREASEAGAQAALLHLGVTEEEAPAHLDEPSATTASQASRACQSPWVDPRGQ